MTILSPEEKLDGCVANFYNEEVANASQGASRSIFHAILPSISIGE